MEKMKMQTTNVVDENIKKIGELFPNCLTERLGENGKPKVAIDFDLLRQELSKDIVEGPEERYQFTWPDKRNAIRLANAPTTDTLRPCREESVDFDNTQNLYIEGDNLQVLKLLRENYLGKIKMIYIDPPYNTGNDFVYNDDFSQSAGEYVHNSGQEDEEGNRLVANTESNGRFHTDWLNMIYPRLKVAKDLLSEDGMIFLSIDDNEQSNLIKICNELFGSENFQGMFVINASPSAIDYGNVAKMHEYALMYSKNAIEVTTNQLQEKNKTYKYTDELGGFNIYPLYNGNVAFNPSTRPNLYYPFYLNTENKLDNGFFEIGLENKKGWKEVWPVVSKKDGIARVWRWGKDKSKENVNKEIVGYLNEDGEYRIVQKYRGDKKTIRSLLLDNSMSSRRGTAEVQSLFEKKVFSFPKPINLVKQFVTVGANSDSVILDFFSGSATSAHSVMQLNAEDGGNRKYIMVQLPEATDKKSEAYKAGYKNLCEIGKERIRRAGKKIIEEQKAKQGDLFSDEPKKLDVGFRVLKLDSSNMQEVYYTPADFNEQKLFADNIKPDRTDEDLLFQAMIELGIELSAKIEKREIAGKTVWSVSEGYLMACFDENMNENTITEIARQHPYYFVMRDSSLATDNVADNFEQIWEEYSKDTVRRIL